MDLQEIQNKSNTLLAGTGVRSLFFRYLFVKNPQSSHQKKDYKNKSAGIRKFIIYRSLVRQTVLKTFPNPHKSRVLESISAFSDITFVSECDMFFTNDKQLRQEKELPCMTMDDLLLARIIL